ncbi:MAG: M61 family metallopeptidase [Gemmatimonadaceae bacterium]
MQRRILSLLVIGSLGACRAPATVSNGSSTREEQRASEPRFEIAYHLAMPDPASHLYDVQIDIGNVTGGDLRLQMPVWSPGRYARFDFARTMQDLTIVGSGGTPLQWVRENGSLWRVHLAGTRSIVVHYRVFANTLSGTFSVLDTAHANWNGASLFMYVVDHKPDPVTLHVTLPAGWHIVNGDARTPDQADYRFENYDRLIDTPTEVALSLMVDSFKVDGRIYRTMVHHNGGSTPAQRRRFVGDVQKIVRYENTVFGPPPLEMYTFIFNIGYPGGDGMEHLFSTQIIDRDPWRDEDTPLAGIESAAHEYFHVWNVKRVRPLALGPFDYTAERYQPSLWVAEGWTQYYGQVALFRAGVLPTAGFYSMVANSIARPNLTAPGRKEVSARMASFEAPFWDGAQPGFAVNRNSFFSYYTKGAGLALYLDLLIRARSGNARSLDDAFRNLRVLSWEQPNASYYLQGRGYTEDDVERAVSEAAGTDLHGWFMSHVGGTEDPDFDTVLAEAGLRLIRGAANWSLEEVPNATPAQLAVRVGWVNGRSR